MELVSGGTQGEGGGGGDEMVLLVGPHCRTRFEASPSVPNMVACWSGATSLSLWECMCYIPTFNSKQPRKPTPHHIMLSMAANFSTGGGCGRTQQPEY